MGQGIPGKLFTKDGDIRPVIVYKWPASLALKQNNIIDDSSLDWENAIKLFKLPNYPKLPSRQKLPPQHPIFFDR